MRIMSVLIMIVVSVASIKMFVDMPSQKELAKTIEAVMSNNAVAKQ